MSLSQRWWQMSPSPEEVTRQTPHIPGHGFRTYCSVHKCDYGCDAFCDEEGQIAKEYVTEEAFRDWVLKKIEWQKAEFEGMQKAHERFVEAVSKRGVVIPISEILDAP